MMYTDSIVQSRRKKFQGENLTGTQQDIVGQRTCLYQVLVAFHNAINTVVLKLRIEQAREGLHIVQRVAMLLPEQR